MSLPGQLVCPGNPQSELCGLDHETVNWAKIGGVVLTIASSFWGAVKLKTGDLIKQNESLLKQNNELFKTAEKLKRDLSSKVDAVAAEISPADEASLRQLVTETAHKLDAEIRERKKEHGSNTNWLERIEDSANLNRKEILSVREGMNDLAKKSDRILEMLIEKAQQR